MSFTATNSMAGSPSEARKMLRPMRPNPLIPTLIGILPPRCGGDSSAQQDRTERKPETKQTMLGRVSGKVKPREPGAWGGKAASSPWRNPFFLSDGSDNGDSGSFEMDEAAEAKNKGLCYRCTSGSA